MPATIEMKLDVAAASCERLIGARANSDRRIGGSDTRNLYRPIPGNPLLRERALALDLAY
jgi:hypothetical protein